MKPTIRSAYNYDTDAASIDSGLSCPEESKAVQSQKTEADINTIVKRFGLTGQLPPNIRVPQYGDFTGAKTYHEYHNALTAANQAFNALPAHLRAKFHDSPEEFVNFCTNPDNQDELIKLGLADRKEGLPPKGGVPPTVEGSKPVEPTAPNNSSTKVEKAL